MNELPIIDCTLTRLEWLHVYGITVQYITEQLSVKYATNTNDFKVAVDLMDILQMELNPANNALPKHERKTITIFQDEMYVLLRLLHLQSTNPSKGLDHGTINTIYSTFKAAQVSPVEH